MRGFNQSEMDLVSLQNAPIDFSKLMDLISHITLKQFPIWSIVVAYICSTVHRNNTTKEIVRETLAKWGLSRVLLGSVHSGLSTACTLKPLMDLTRLFIEN